MTLIATVICNQGIIQASDSNLTSSSRPVEAGQKVFRLGFADGALALAGAYAVGTERMDNWLPARIASYSASATPSLSGFADYLAAQLESSSTPGKARLFHIAGYTHGEGGIHPEFYFVRNIQGINITTGDYEGVTSKYQVTEDFWTRDYLQAPAGMFAAGYSWRYFNGYPPGRIAYLGAMRKLREFYVQVWHEPSWKFRQPASLDEVAAFVRLELETINTLFTSSDYPTPYVGGDIQIEKIPAPSGTLRGPRMTSLSDSCGGGMPGQ
jgi:hypothetical protein